MSPQRPLNELGELQRTVLEAVWELGEATVAQMRRHINRTRSKKLAYTTILSVMQKLESDDWLTHRAEGRTYVYQAKRSRQEAGSASLRNFVNQVFGGDPLVMFQHLLQDQELSNNELKELREMIERHRKGRRK